MKRGVFGFLAILLSAQYAWAAVDTSKIASATTPDDARREYEMAAAKVLSDAEKKVSADVKKQAEEKIQSVKTKAESGDLTGGNEEPAAQESGKKDSTDITEKKERTAEEQAELNKKAEEAEAAYADAKATEQSDANKLLGATGIASVGAGAQMLASGLAEKNADESAELDMKAYLATFKCRYGDGKMVAGGATNVALPGGNQLTTLVQEYKALAADLQIRKEALNMLPGIESEEILDKSTLGLYDDVSLGKTDGTYTSLSRALLDENSADAAEWAAQKEETSKSIKTGAIVAGVGIVGTAVANAIINRDTPDEDAAEKFQEYSEQVSEPIQELQAAINKLPDFTPTSCQTNPNTIVNMNTNTCVANNTPAETCSKASEYTNSTTGACACPTDTHFISEKDGNKCRFLYDSYNTAVALGSITLPADKVFDAGKNTVTADVATALKEFGSDAKSKMDKIASKLTGKDYCILVVGHTDHIGTVADNKKISHARADAIKNAITTSGLKPVKTKSIGLGETYCENGDETTGDANCRRVVVSVIPEKCSTTLKVMQEEHEISFGSVNSSN